MPIPAPTPAEPAAAPEAADPTRRRWPASAAAPAPPDAGPPATAGTATEARRLEQHFVYNALNTIAALIRTDPAGPASC